MAARFVSSVITTRQVRGCASRYFFTVFFDSPTLIASTVSPLSENSCESFSTSGASSSQKWHQVVQNSSRTTLPLIEALSNLSPSRLRALNRGAGSFVALTANVPVINKASAKHQNRRGRVGDMTQVVSPDLTNVNSLAVP